MKKIFLLIALLPVPIAIGAQTWKALSVGTNDGATSLAVYNGSLYLGGFFTTAGIANAAGIAAWNGTTWAALDSGINDGLNTLLAFDSVLYVGGIFTDAGGKTTNNIAQWDGTNWTVWGTGAVTTFGAPCVNAMVIYKGKLIIGGQFNTVDGAIATSIAEWDGIKWASLGSGIMLDAYNGSGGGLVNSLAVYKGQLFVGGSFDSVQGSYASNIASWDGTNWHVVGSGINGSGVNALCVWNGNLCAGGDFDTAGGILAQELAEWNGTSWSEFGNGANSDVNVLFPYGNKLYVGGYFTSVGSTFANSIAQWDGTNWSAMSSGMTANLSPAVYAIGIYNSSLYACGQFDDAGGNPVNNIAEWTGSVGINEINSNMNFSIYPNPNNGTFTISSNHAELVSASQNTIVIYNVLGECVYSAVMPQTPKGAFPKGMPSQSVVDLKGQANGVYFYKILGENEELIGDGKVIIQK